ncbi:MAG: TonB-dependent receptor [Saprospiraceae bacterium]|nr:TonB-dependent receptor [Saprospiraceae bacterium]
MRKVITLFGLFFFFLSAQAQLTLSGYVTNEKGEKLEGAVVFIDQPVKAVAADRQGFYLIDGLAPGSYKVSSSYLGYETVSQLIGLAKNQKLDLVMRGNIYQLDEVEIRSNVNKLSAFPASREVKAEELRDQNFGQDVPVLLQWQPSVTTSTDAGAGVGYTSMRIRGVEQSRINVTINDIPLNDAESQGVFWVDLPDLASSTENIHIQRGVGPSTNGAGAYGGTVSINTFGLDVNPSVGADFSIGSFNTRKLTVKLNSGLLNNKYNVDARYSTISSAGYIDRARADLKSWYIEGARVGSTSSLRLIAFSGSEETYQAWNGVPEALLSGDRNALLKHYQNNQYSLYLGYADSLNLFTSDRRYNAYLYEDQVDNYTQTHVQLHYAKAIGKKWKLKGALHLTTGKGYFEQYQYSEDLNAYGLPAVAVNDDTLTTADLVRRRWLDNQFYGTVFKAEYQAGPNNTWSIGGGLNKYVGDHFGNVLKVPAAPEFRPRGNYYQSDADKNDANVYLRYESKIMAHLLLSGDLQYRQVQYRSLGTDNNFRTIDFNKNYHFFNPKFSLNYLLNPDAKLLFSYAVAQREPDRSDFTDNEVGFVAESEYLTDWELGYELKKKNWTLEGNVYYMKYHNQLIPTGALNDVGSPLRKNVEDSFRMGLEFMGGLQLGKGFRLLANTTLSQNKIRAFDEVLYDYTQGQEIVTINHQHTDIAFSPNLIVTGTLAWDAGKNITAEFTSRYIGRQYLDNTQNDQRSLPAYTTSMFRVSYRPKLGFAKQTALSLQVNNVFNAKYSSGGYTYTYRYNDWITENFLYPQAGLHFNVALSIQL